MNQLAINSATIGIVISILGFEIGVFLRDRYKWPIFNPLLVAIVFVIIVLNVFRIDYASYYASADNLSYFLTPATVCLAIPLYQQLELLKKHKKAILFGVLSGVLTSLCTVWQVNKRYLNDDMFVEHSVKETAPNMTNADKLILQDKSLDYRVLNLASNTFNENETSYYHKSIGGYHPAKLRRYQEMIEHYIAPEMQKMLPEIAKHGGDMSQINGNSLFPVLNMLNTKYFILPLQQNQTIPLQNPYAYGNAWFVDKIRFVNNANEEIDLVGKLNLRHEAVADKAFKEQLKNSVPQGKTSNVVLNSYAPNALSYTVNSDKGGVVVFSEVYYPGWKATIDGKEASLGRVNYILRALNVSAGKHEVKLVFDPTSVHTTETIAYIAFGILVLLIAVVCFLNYKKTQN